MDEYYKGLLLTPDLYHSSDLSIHVELGEDMYQINDDGILVANSYPNDSNKTVYPNFFQRYVKVQQKNIHYVCMSLVGNLMKMIFVFSKWNCYVKFQN